MLKIATTPVPKGCSQFIRPLVASTDWNKKKYDYDVVVIGSGPGGHAVSLGCSKHGMRVACVESKRLGGTCLNSGCIPSKCLLHSSKTYYSLINGGKSHFCGINLRHKLRQDPLSIVRTMENKNVIIRSIVSDVDNDFKRNRVDFFSAHAQLTERRGEVMLSDGRTLRSRYVVLAPGSESRTLPHMPGFDEKRILSSAGALSLGHVPRRMVVIGAGVIGLELGSIWHGFGSKVTFIDRLDRVARDTDHEISEHVKASMERQGMQFILGTQVTSVVRRKDGVEINIRQKSCGGDGKKKKGIVVADSAVVCVGRNPVVKGLGLDAAGVKTENGRILVDDHYRTSVDNVYAIGDAIGGKMLAHKAESEGYSVAHGLGTSTPPVKINYNLIPGVLFTTPEVAWVGLTEHQAKERGYKRVKSVTYPICGDKESLAKVVLDEKLDKILGIHLVGPNTAEMIFTCTMAIEKDLSSFGDSVYPHPTATDVLKKFALAFSRTHGFSSKVI